MIVWYYLVIISAILNALALIVEKKLLRSEHALSFSISLSFAIGLLSLFLVPFADFSISPFQALLFLIYSVLLALSYWMTARLFRHGSLSTGSPIYNVLPIILVVVLAFLLLDENIGVTRYLAIAAILAATLIMVEESNKKRDTFGRKHYTATIVAVAVLLGIANTFLKYALTQANVFTFMLFTSVITPFMISLLAFGRPVEYKRQVLNDARKFIVPLALIGILTISYRVFLYSALSVAPVSIAIPLSSAIIVMITILSGGLLFGEHHISRKIALSAVILVAAYFLVAA